MNLKECPCCSGQNFQICCEPYLKHHALPNTPEALMRSRYTAYSVADINYIKETMRSKAALNFKKIAATRWAKRVIWLNLKVIAADIEGLNKGYVEFIATYIDKNQLQKIHERSEFIKESGKWYYIDGAYVPTDSEKQLISRSSLCPCGSLSKFKNCHGK